MNEVNKTMYIPLFGKALISRRGIILQDKKAEEIWEKEQFPLKGKAASKWLALYMTMRATVFDRWLQDKMNNHPNAVVLHIGCGMDSRILRVGNRDGLWYDVDFPDVIEQRRRYFGAIPGYHMIGADARQSAWLNNLPYAQDAIVVMEGISMYMTTSELTDLLMRLKNHFGHVHLLMDSYTEFAARASKYKNPVNEVGVTNLYGLDDPYVLENSGLSFRQEQELTPQYLIDQLTGMEKWIFRKVFAGSFSKRLYRLYEFFG